MLRVGLVTLFPELFGEFLRTSFVGRAMGSGKLQVDIEQLREHGLGKHRAVDDTPYGGGAGMLLRVDCVVSAIEALDARLQPPAEPRPRRILLSPQGQRFDQATARRWNTAGSLLLVCGRYEGFDERVRDFVDEEASLGDFVLTGGEVAAMAIIEACVRLVPGVLGNEDSAREESFGGLGDPAETPGQTRLTQTGAGLEYPQFTRPAVFRERGVPEVLKGGNHSQIAAWRSAESKKRTLERRPDLLALARAARDSKS